MLTVKKAKRVPVVAWGMLGAIFLAFGLAIPAMAAQPSAATYALYQGKNEATGSARQVLSGDFTVEDGQVIDDDVFVYSGNVQVDNGGKITGDLIVFSGNIALEEESEVGGDVINYSGNVDVAGQIGGDLTVWSGDVDLSSTADVGGDISVASGSLDRDDGASVEGSVIDGPQFRFPSGFGSDRPRKPDQSGVSFGPPAPTFFGRILGLFGRLFVAALMTAFTMLLVGGLFYIRPQLIVDTRKTLREQLALSAIIGGIANLMVLFLAGLLAVTICLLPLALAPLLLLLAVNIVGWAVASQILGERIVGVSKQPVQPILTILVGALFLSGFCALLWAFGGCFRVVAFLAIFAVSSLGAGAVLAPWINRKQPPSGGSDSGGQASTRGPVSPMTPPSTGVQPDSDLAAPLDYVTAEEINAGQEQPQKPASRTANLGATDAVTTPATAATADEPVETDVAAPIDYVTAQEVNTGEAIGSGDDFSQIKGIGPIYARRLKDAGFTTFAHLANASVEQVAGAIGWPADRVRRVEVIDQAKVLAKKA